EGYIFPIAVDMPLEGAGTMNVNVGDLGYSPPQKTLTIFYGPTPASPGDRPVPPTKVNPVGRILDDPPLLRVVAGVGKIRLRRADSDGAAKPSGKSGLRRRS